MKNNFTSKIKNIFTLSLLAKLLTIAVIVISTLLPSLFDPQGADWKKVLSNFIFSLVIALGGFISQMIAARNRECSKDTYINSRDRHIKQIHEIQKRQLSHFHKLYVQDTNKQNEIEYVKDVFQQFEIDFKFYDMELSLVKTALKKGVIDKEQYSVIQLCRKGKIQFDKYDIRDLTATQVLKNGMNTNKSQQAQITASNLLSKMSIMLAFAIIGGMFVWDEQSAAEGVSNSQAWIDLAFRLITFVGGIWTGETTGKEIVCDDIRLFDKFFNFNCKFIQDFDLGIWKPKEQDVAEDIVAKLQRLQAEDNSKLSKEPSVQEQEHQDNELDEDVVYETIEVTEEEFHTLLNK